METRSRKRSQDQSENEPQDAAPGSLTTTSSSSFSHRQSDSFTFNNNNNNNMDTLGSRLGLSLLFNKSITKVNIKVIPGQGDESTAIFQDGQHVNYYMKPPPNSKDHRTINDFRYQRSPRQPQLSFGGIFLNIMEREGPGWKYTFEIGSWYRKENEEVVYQRFGKPFELKEIPSATGPIMETMSLFKAISGIEVEDNGTLIRLAVKVTAKGPEGWREHREQDSTSVQQAGVVNLKINPAFSSFLKDIVPKSLKILDNPQIQLFLKFTTWTPLLIHSGNGPTDAPYLTIYYKKHHRVMRFLLPSFFRNKIRKWCFSKIDGRGLVIQDWFHPQGEWVIWFSDPDMIQAVQQGNGNWNYLKTLFVQEAWKFIEQASPSGSPVPTVDEARQSQNLGSLSNLLIRFVNWHPIENFYMKPELLNLNYVLYTYTRSFYDPSKSVLANASNEMRINLNTGLQEFRVSAACKEVETQSFGGKNGIILLRILRNHFKTDLEPVGFSLTGGGYLLSPNGEPVIDDIAYSVIEVFSVAAREQQRRNNVNAAPRDRTSTSAPSTSTSSTSASTKKTNPSVTSTSAPTNSKSKSQSKKRSSTSEDVRSSAQVLAEAKASADASRASRTARANKRAEKK